MTVSVTRHAVKTENKTEPNDFRPLVAGFDTLDLGLYCDWGGRMAGLSRELEAKRQEAQGTDGIIWHKSVLSPCMVKPSGRPPMYRYHVQLPDYHVFFGQADKATKGPNVYVSPSARTLWCNGPTATVETIVHLIREMGADVMSVQPSRCDLAADFVMPNGPSFDFLRSHAVCQSRKLRPYLDNDEVETCYFGNKGAPIQGRIYNKAKEIIAGNGQKLWFLSVWELDTFWNVWRVEFQVRRSILRQFKVDTVDDLLRVAPAIWHYLTHEWRSLRLQDSPYTPRRTVHPWWQAVQGCEGLLGPPCDVIRDLSATGNASVQWYVSHIAGCLTNYAARQGLELLPDALGDLGQQVTDYWQARNWQDTYTKARIKLGLMDGLNGGSDVPF